jgi:nicotinate phosphoribosyltransferase
MMTPQPLLPLESRFGAATDLYELTMAAAYFESGVSERKATFELFTRQLPENRSFLVTAGLEQAVHYLLNLRFSGEVIDYLRGLAVFRLTTEDFFDYLSGFRFTGDVWAVPEGTIVFENEPVLQVSAPVIEAQICETYLLTSVNMPTAVASKAARMALAAEGRRVIDFGSRRAHGPQAGVMAARAAYIGGCAGTSNVLAGLLLGVPVFGTMAHSFVQFFEDEIDAFQAYFHSFPKHTTLLVDTYDTLEGTRLATRFGRSLRGIRIDSGDLAQLSRKAREILDNAGLKDCQIFVSGNLDEAAIQELTVKGAPIDGYGVGTQLVVSGDAPGCDVVYKLVASEDPAGRIRGRYKTSPDKATLPFRKQVYRMTSGGRLDHDLITAWDEPLGPGLSESVPLLEMIVEGGELVRALPTLDQIGSRCHEQRDRLPDYLRSLEPAERYSVRVSEKLQSALEQLEDERDARKE